MTITGDPQGTQSRAIASEGERSQPGYDDTPAPGGWKQLLAFGLIAGVPVAVYLLGRWLR